MPSGSRVATIEKAAREAAFGFAGIGAIYSPKSSTRFTRRGHQNYLDDISLLPFVTYILLIHLHSKRHHHGPSIDLI